MTEPFVSVIVVNYNGQSHLAACLGSLARQTYPRHRFEVLLIDNGSSDGSIELIGRDFPWVRVMPQRANLGFAAGNNVGFGVARGEWFALLNADAAADPDWQHRAVEAGEAARDIGGVACQLIFRDDPNRINSTGLELYRDGRGGDRDIGTSVALCQNEPDVFGGCGAALLLRREMVEQLGGFDPRLFMYYEDLDLAWRARRAGWKFVYCSQAKATHVFGASAGVASPFQTRFVQRNRVLVNLRHAPCWLGVASGLGLVGRAGRCMWRFVRGTASAGHVFAHARALAEVVVRLPSIVGARLTERGADRLFRQWSRPRS